VNSFVANFIGENNVLAGTIENIEKGYCRRRPGLRRLRRGPGVTWPAQAPPPPCRCGRERVSILTDGAASEGPNRLPATVQNTIYLGDHALAVLQVAGNEEFMVSFSRARMEA